MDIEVCYKEMMEAARQLQGEMDKEGHDSVVISQLGETLAERVIDLDGWLTKKGAKPKSWDHGD